MFLRQLLEDDPVQALPVVIAIALIYWFVRRSQHKRKFADDFAGVRRRCRFNELARLLFVCCIAELICCTLTPTAFWYKLWHFMAFDPLLGVNVRFQRLEHIPKPLANVLLGTGNQPLCMAVHILGLRGQHRSLCSTRLSPAAFVEKG